MGAGGPHWRTSVESFDDLVRFLLAGLVGGAGSDRLL